MSRPFHWGIIGPGKIAHQFASDISKIKGCKLHAVASRSIDRAQSFAQQYEAPHAFGAYQDIINCPELDAVYIATPHTSHFENTVLCLNAGIPVLCEKPFALNTDQARQMMELARANDVFLMEALWTRFLPSMLKTMELINSGAIGEIVSIKADFGFKAPFNPESRIFNPELGGGSLLDIGIYPVFLALLLLGKPQHIKAFANFGATGVDMDCGMLLQFEDQKLAHLHSTLLSRTKTEAFIYGTEGTIHIHTRWHEATSISLISLDGRPDNFHFDWPDNGYGFEAKEVMKCIALGLKESPSRTLDDTLLLMETLDAIRAEIGLSYPGEV